MAKPKRIPHGGPAPVTTVQPRWGKIGDINFKWKHLAGIGHTESQCRDLEEILRRHFRAIGLVGDFAVQARAQKNGTSDTKGLTVIRSLGTRNDVLFAYQPGDNGSRFTYAVIFPERMVHEVHGKFMESVDAERRGEDVTDAPTSIAGQMIANMAAVTGAVMGMTTQAMDAMLHPVPTVAADSRAEQFPTHEFHDVTGELVILQLKFDTAGVPTEALCRDLEEVLTKHGSGEAIFTIKRSSNVHTLPKNDDSYGIKWCALQPGSQGIGFFYRVDVKQVWEKFALVPDTAFSFDLQRFSDTVLGKNPILSVVSGGKGGGVVSSGQKSTGVNDYAHDALGAALVLVHMSRSMRKDGSQLLPRQLVTELFRNHVTSDVNAGAIGRIFTHWEDNGWVKRLKDGYRVEYTLGEKADKLLPDTDRDIFYTLYPRRRPVWIDVAVRQRRRLLTLQLPLWTPGRW